MVASAKKSVTVPLVRPEVRRDLYRNALALGRGLPVRGGDQDQVHVNHVLRRTVSFAAVAALLTPFSELHQPPRESHNGPFANRGAFTRRVEAEEDTAVRGQVRSIPGFRHRRFLVEPLLKLLEAREGHERRSSSRAEVILGEILERVGGIVRRNWWIGHVAAGETGVVYWVMLRDIRKRDRTIRDETLSAG
jgi:hypothetical protein